MSKGSKKNKKKINKVNNVKVVKKSDNVDNNKTLKDKIELFMYIGQYVIFIIGVFGILASLILLGVSYYYLLVDNYDTILGSLLVSIILLVNFFTFGKFKEIRKKYSNKKKRGK